MKSALLTILTSSLACLTLTAQSVRVDMGPEYVFENNEEFDKNLYSDNTGHYVSLLHFRKAFNANPTIVLSKFDKKFNQKWSYDYELEEKDDRHHGLYRLGDKFMWVFSKEKRRSKNRRVYNALPIDRNGDLLDDMQLHDVSEPKRRFQPEVLVTTSLDTSLMAVALLYDRNEERDDFEYHVSVLDDTGTQRWTAAVVMDKSQEQVVVLDDGIDNNGNYYLLVKEYEQRNARESKKVETRAGKERVAAYTIKVYTLSEGMTKPKVVDLDMDGRFERGGTIAVIGDGSVRAIGMYSINRRRGPQGVYSIGIGSSGEVQDAHYRDFSASDMDELAGRLADEDRSGNQELEGVFGFRTMMIHGDGSVTATVESNYTRVQRDIRGQVRNVTYHSDDIIVIEFSPEGKFRSVRFVPKRQASSRDFFLSHTGVLVDDKAYFIYNDDEDNLGRDLDKIPRRAGSLKESITVLAHMDGEDLVRESIISNERSRFLMLPHSMTRISDNKYFFITRRASSLKKARFRMGTIEF